MDAVDISRFNRVRPTQDDLTTASYLMAQAHRIRVFQAGDEDLACGVCGRLIEPSPDGWRHLPEEEPPRG